MVQTINQRVSNPTAFITKNKQRIKQYGNIVYLNDKDEFEIELFNPTQNKILAKIYLNDTPLNSGLSLRPGERVFLERFMDSSNKFIFETYNVNNNIENKSAIQNNGNVKIEFFNEYISYTNQPFYYGNHDFSYPLTHHVTPHVYDYTNVPDAFHTINNTGNNSTNCFFSNTSSLDIKCNVEKTKIETGRIEKGSISNQKFQTDHSSFYFYPSQTIEWKILPHSRKEIVSDDLKVYCTNCGKRRRKTSDKYCSNCGNKF